ncbi:unnamed protein product [Closterium sp. NIES-53]
MHTDPEHRWDIATIMVQEALASWKGKAVKAAMDEEIRSLIGMGTGRSSGYGGRGISNVTGSPQAPATRTAAPAACWVFYDPVTHQFFASQDVTFNESVSYYRSCPHRGSEAFSPPLFLTLEPLPVAPVAPPPSRPALSSVSQVTPQCLVPLVSGGAGGAVAEGEGTGPAGARGAGSRDVGGVRVETAPEEDTAVSTQWPLPGSPPGFPSVPQFPHRSPLWPVAAEPGGVPAGGTGDRGGVVGGGSGSRAAAAAAVSVRASGESRGGVTAIPGESRGGVMAAAAAVSIGALGESRGGVMTTAAGAVAATLGETKAGFSLAIAGAVAASAGESRARVPAAAACVVAATAGESRGGATGAATGAGAAAVVARDSRAAVT